MVVRERSAMAPVVALLLLALVFATPIPAEAESFKGTVYSLPAGWVTAEQEGVLLLAPADADEETAVVVVLFPAAPLSGRSSSQWLPGKMKELLSPDAKVVGGGGGGVGNGRGREGSGARQARFNPPRLFREFGSLPGPGGRRRAGVGAA